MRRRMYSLVGFALLLLVFNNCAEKSDSAALPNSNGIGGSMARFAITGNYLYIVNNTNLKVFDINQETDPKPGADIKLGIGIETIFPYQDKLFIGSQDGMHIYDNAQPANPELISVYNHVQSCDPVVVEGNYAYVTLRNGNTCRNGANLLDIVNISDLKAPQLVKSISMLNPHGLGVDGNDLFVCEGDFGLKIFDTSNPENPVQTQFIQDIKTFDVIPRAKLLLVTGKDGLYQYDYSDPSQIRLLSKIPIAF